MSCFIPNHNESKTEDKLFDIYIKFYITGLYKIRLRYRFFYSLMQEA
jgi:hypothetical protein